MTLPTKPNPRKHTVTTKVTREVYKGLQQTALLECDGNMSLLVSQIISCSVEAEPVPDEIFQESLQELQMKKKGEV